MAGYRGLAAIAPDGDEADVHEFSDCIAGISAGPDLFGILITANSFSGRVLALRVKLHLTSSPFTLNSRQYPQVCGSLNLPLIRHNRPVPEPIHRNLHEPDHGAVELAH